MVHLLSASAGSGKTYALALTFLKELAKRLNLKANQEEGDLPLLSSILVLTFTNKASFEMKERILSFLESISLRKGNWETLSEETGLSPDTAQILLNHLFLHYHKLQVSTIDSYLYRLFRGLAYELELPSKLMVEKTLEQDFLEMALLNFYARAKDDDGLMSKLIDLIDFILEEEETGTINLKNRLIRGLNDYIEKHILRGKEVELNADLEDTQNRRPYLRAQLYYSLFQELKQDLEQILLSHRRVYMGFWKEKLKRYLSEEGFLPWIYFKLGKVECLIKDESQDTDVLHYHNLYPIFENLLSEDCPIYLAWDPKQSIYRWRGADPDYLFSWKTSLIQKGYEVSEQKLEKNYRSSSNIVDFNNRFFFPFTNEERTALLLTPLLRDYCGLNSNNKDQNLSEVKEFFYRTFVPNFCRKVKETYKDLVQSSESNALGKVVIYYVRDDNQDSFQEKLFEVVEVLLRELREVDERAEKGGSTDGESVSTTAILLRENKDITELYQFLWDKGFTVASREVAKFNKSPFILGLIGYLELLLDERNYFALCKVLVNLFPDQGPQILDRYASLGKDSKYSLWDFLKEYDSKFFKENFFDPLEKGRLLTPYDFLQYLWRTLRLSERFPEEKPFFYSFLSLVFSKQKEGFSLQKLLSILEKEIKTRSPRLPERSEVTLMTIHSAKGLEFDNVITILNYPRTKGSSPVKLQTRRGCFLGKKTELKDSKEWEPYLNDRADEFLEMINLIYVSFTRAKKNLFIIVPYRIEKGRVESQAYSAKLFLKIRDSLSWNFDFVEERGEIPKNH